MGSGGGTTWLLEPPGEKRPLMYPWRSGWDRRSVSCCMPEAKPPFARICAIRENIDSDPVFRWARGQRLSQNLLSLQLPLYERIMKKAPESLHTLIASGDVYIRANQPLQEIPEVDVVCYVYGSSLRWPRITGFLYRAVSLRTLWTSCYRSLRWKLWGNWRVVIYS